jgi:hypothetical protein
MPNTCHRTNEIVRKQFFPVIAEGFYGNKEIKKKTVASCREFHLNMVL